MEETDKLQKEVDSLGVVTDEEKDVAAKIKTLMDDWNNLLNSAGSIPPKKEGEDRRDQLVISFEAKLRDLQGTRLLFSKV